MYLRTRTGAYFELEVARGLSEDSSENIFFYIVIESHSKVVLESLQFVGAAKHVRCWHRASMSQHPNLGGLLGCRVLGENISTPL